MKKAMVLFIAVLGLVVAVPERSRLQAAVAPPQFQQAPQEGKGCSVPKAWGPVKGVGDRSIAFEDSAGTIRVVDIGPCMRGQTQLIVVISRP